MKLLTEIALFLCLLGCCASNKRQVQGRVAFRLDDVQDFFVSPSQQAVINKFCDHGIPLTIGVIGNMFGTDTANMNFLRQRMADPRCKLEVASHGYNHEDFTQFTLSQQETLILASKTKIQDSLGVMIKANVQTFLPPFNKFNQDTVTALKSKGFKYLSSTLAMDIAPFPLQGADFYRFPVGAATASETFVGYSAQRTIDDIKNQILAFGFSVVMMHPQEFAVNKNQPVVDINQMDQLEALLKLVKAEGFTLRTIGSLNLEADPPVPVTTGVATTGAATSGVATTGTVGTTGKPVSNTKDNGNIKEGEKESNDGDGNGGKVIVWVLAIGGSVLVVAIAAVLGFLVWKRRQQPEEEEPQIPRIH